MKRILGLIALTLLVLTRLSTATVFAQSVTPTASLNFKLSSFEVQTGKDFTFDVEVDTGGPAVNIAQACVTYDHEKFDLVTVTYGNTPFTQDVPKSPSSDCVASSLQISRYDLSAKPTGKFPLAHVTLKPKGPNSTSTLGFDFGKSLVFSPESPGTNILKETAKAQLTIASNSSTPADSKSASKNFIYLVVALLVVAATIVALIKKRRPAKTKPSSESEE